MEYFSTLSGSFDESLATFPLLTKIKLIGEIYMCASGLFSPNENPCHMLSKLFDFAFLLCNY
jgi:hypothetical protein